MESLTETTAVQKGVTALKNLFSAAKSAKDFGIIKQITSVRVWPWLASLLVFTPFVLYHYLSPLVMKMALAPVVAPIAGLFMIILGEFDLSKLSVAMSSNAGLILKIGGTLTFVLFVQNCIKSALFLQSLWPWNKQNCAYSLAGIFTPITTVAIMYTLFSFGLLLKLQTVIIGFLAIFTAEGGSAAVKAATQSMQDKNSIDLKDLQIILSYVSDGLRIGLGVIFTAWVILIGYLYYQTHKVLHNVFEMLLNIFDPAKVKPILVLVKDKLKKYFKIFWGFYSVNFGWAGTIIIGAILCIAYWIVFAGPIFNKLNGASCNKGTMQGTYGGQFIVLADLKNKGGKCYDVEDIKKLKVGDSFTFENNIYYIVVIKDHIEKNVPNRDGSGVAYVDYADAVVDKNKLVWMIKPKTFDQKGFLPEDFPDFSKVGKVPPAEVNKLEDKK